ncbi:ribbon-helix-helix domain-containing protein [Asticcacaulis sp. AC460]|uniref:ribbon-helix-helix domain-containing protein n=1 Tax=Asticcacaulis sp. AC460 TaxID=1282360 RepID=UPI00041241FE|nr:hypothetical protein [Asticcacaulis sp. AC460]
MDRITVSLDDGNSDWVQQQAGANVDAYVNDVLRRDQERKAAEAKLRDLIQEGLDSGISPRTPQEIIADAKARLRADGHL